MVFSMRLRDARELCDTIKRRGCKAVVPVGYGPDGYFIKLTESLELIRSPEEWHKYLGEYIRIRDSGIYERAILQVLDEDGGRPIFQVPISEWYDVEDKGDLEIGRIRSQLDESRPLLAYPRLKYAIECGYREGERVKQLRRLKALQMAEEAADKLALSQDDYFSELRRRYRKREERLQKALFKVDGLLSQYNALLRDAIRP